MHAFDFIGSNDDIRDLPNDNDEVSDSLLPTSGHEPLDLSSLSEREREILSAAARGLSARDIASGFTLSEATVRSHLASIYSKLGVAGRVELLARLNEGPTPAEVMPQSWLHQPAELTTTRVDALHRPNSRLTGWLSGLVVGAASGFLALLAGPLGLVPAIGFLPVAVRSRQTLASLAGLLTGAGAIALGMITAANASCTTVVTPTSYSSCTAPDLTGWVMLASFAAAVGALLSIAAIRRT
jgi:DNA-binding CsgD family transcriptional regulator